MVSNQLAHELIYMLEWAFFVVRIMSTMVIFSFTVMAIITICVVGLKITRRHKK